MKILLLCKGPGIKLFDNSKSKNFDTVCWANLHSIHPQIPNKLDILFLRDINFYLEQDEFYKNYLKNLNIKEIIHTSSSQKIDIIPGVKILYGINPNKYQNHNSSTGVLAFRDLCNRKPTTLSVAGLDLFQIGKPTYYSNVKDTPSSKALKQSLLPHIKDGLNTINYHNESISMEIIKQGVDENPNTQFEFFSTNKIYSKTFKDYNNVNIING